jgi:hypothetical protein
MVQPRRKERGWPHKIWRDEGEGDLNVTEIKTDRQWPETIRNEYRLYRKPRSTTDCSA